MPTCSIISFRLGGTDGVSVVARLWQQILNNLGFSTYTIAGAGTPDVLLPKLAIGANSPPDPAELNSALANSDLTLVENIGSIPLNLPASLSLLEVLKGRPAIMHHHDPPWQREHWGHITELPGDDPAWQHVAINDLTQTQMVARGFAATRIYNPFNTNSPPGDRAATRKQLAVSEAELLVVHPVRAIRRKNILAALNLTEQLGGTYWLPGSAEDDYGPMLTEILSSANCRVLAPSLASGSQPPKLPSPAIYAAADLVAYPSWWEGFGNPPIEAAIHQRPAVVGDYPVAQELRRLGFHWFYPWQNSDIADFLATPNQQLLAHNRALVEQHFSIPVIQAQVKQLLADAGWL